MAISPRLEIKQSQSLLMTQQLRQAINLLQLNNLELNEIIEQELERNPLLEREEEHLNSLPEDNIPSIDDNQLPVDNTAEEFVPDIDFSQTFDDFASDNEDYQINDNYDWSDYNTAKDHRYSEPDFDYFQQRISSSKSLYRHIYEQIGIAFATPKEKIIAQHLTEKLDQAGYFRGNITEISRQLKCSPQIIDKILTKMQQFEPTGIFARDLKECLKLQLQENNRYDPAIAVLLDNLPLLAEGKLKELQKKCSSSFEDIQTMISDIKSLNPKPASSWDFDINTYIIPDVFVRRKKDGNYHIELNHSSLPKILINHRYYSELSDTDKSAKRFLKEHLSSANFLIKALHQRATTLLRVSEELVRTQKDFFDFGIEKLKPLSLKDIAYNLEMHESTISRITTNKYIHTPNGIFELKYFFSSAANSYIGQEDISTLTIKHKIKQIIGNEDKNKILSDDKISDILAQEGIKVARRTIAKYRESLNIPTSAERKRLASQP